MKDKKIVIKIGTAAIFDSKKKKIKIRFLKKLAKDVSKLIKKGNEIIIVSSGAIGCAKELIRGNKSLGLKQAQSSVGQIKLIEKYSKVFSKYKLNAAQFLLTSQDLNDKKKVENIKGTYKNLIGKAIPIINENDVTTINEISFGDNDILASELMIHMNFDILIILTKVGALMKNNKPLLQSNDFSVKDYDNIKIPQVGFGGLKSKLDVAKKIVSIGKKCIIAKAGDKISQILSGKVKATHFVKKSNQNI